MARSALSRRALPSTAVIAVAGHQDDEEESEDDEDGAQDRVLLEPEVRDEYGEEDDGDVQHEASHGKHLLCERVVRAG